MKKSLKRGLAMPSIIQESGMDFIADNSFNIEQYIHDMRIEGIKSVEFIRIKNNDLLFIEAKQTFPNPDNPSSDNKRKFISAISNIKRKFIHSVNAYSSLKIGVSQVRFPDDFVQNTECVLVFVIVIKTHELKWCKPIKTKFMDGLPQYFKTIWKPKVYVINEAKAITMQFAINKENELTTAG
jgi:hypothetical protein